MFRPGRVTSLLMLAVVCAAGLSVRMMVPGTDWFGDTPLPFPDDAPYHLMRMDHVLHGGFGGLSALGEADPMIAHPIGDRCIWPWGFDLFAGPNLVLGKFLPGRTTLIITGMIPPILAMITALMVFWLARAVMRGPDDGPVPHNESQSEGWFIAAAAVFAFLPANVAYTLAGRVDHHVMEPLFMVLPLLFVTGKGRRPSLAACIGGVFCGLAAGYFPASPALTLPLFVITGLLLERPLQVLSWCGGMLGGTTLALFLSPAPFEWVHHSPSVWHIAAVACISCGLLAYSLTSARFKGRGHGLPATIAAGVLAGLVAGSVAMVTVSAVFPEFAASILAGAAYTTSSKLAALSLEASSFLDDPLRLATLTGWMLPLSIAGAALAFVRRPAPDVFRRRLMVVIPAIATITLAAVQRRFLVAATPFIAITAVFGVRFLTGIVATPLANILRRRGNRFPVGTNGPGIGPLTRGLAGVTLVVVMIFPSFMTIMDMEYLTPRDRAMYQAAAAIRRIGVGDGFGTLGPWGYGHLLKYAGATPTVCDNFFGVSGADAAMLRCLGLEYATDDAVINETLDRLKIQFVVLVPPHPEQVRVEASILGLNPSDWVDERDRLSPRFPASFQGKAGMWASRANVGDTGPWGLALRGRFRQVDPATGGVLAEVLLLERRPKTGD